MTDLNAIVTADTQAVTLNTGMTGVDFSKARLMQYLTVKGYIAAPDGNGGFSFSPWTFLQTSEQDGMMCVSGDGFAGTPLYTLLSDAGNTAETAGIADTIHRMIEAAFQQNIPLPVCGPAGILCAPDGRALFLPAEYLERALHNRGEETYSRYLGCWINPGRSGLDAWRYTLACIAYCCVAGTLPFPEYSIQKRHEDFYDGNFMPLEFYPSAMNKTAAAAVSSVLERKKEHAQDTPLPYIAEIVKPDGSAPADAVQTAAFLQRKKRIIQTKRFFRHHSTGITVVAAIIITASAIFATAVSNNGKQPTTQGLTAKQVVDTFYTAMNAQNVDLLKSCLKGSTGKYYVETLSGFYVTNTMRSAYESDTGSIPPAQWLYLQNKTRYWFFGLTHVTANGAPCNTYMAYRLKKDRPPAVPDANGAFPEKGDTESFVCTYYMTRHEGLQRIVVTKHTDTMTLTYSGKQWRITSLAGTLSPVEVDTVAFYKLYTELLKQTDDIPGIAAKMQQQFNWLPDTDEVAAAKELLDTHISHLFSVGKDTDADKAAAGNDVETGN